MPTRYSHSSTARSSLRRSFVRDDTSGESDNSFAIKKSNEIKETSPKTSATNTTSSEQETSPNKQNPQDEKEMKMKLLKSKKPKPKHDDSKLERKKSSLSVDSLHSPLQEKDLESLNQSEGNTSTAFRQLVLPEKPTKSMPKFSFQPQGSHIVNYFQDKDLENKNKTKKLDETLNLDSVSLEEINEKQYTL